MGTGQFVLRYLANGQGETAEEARTFREAVELVILDRLKKCCAVYLKRYTHSGSIARISFSKRGRWFLITSQTR